MEFLNKKQKIILSILLISMLIFIGYYTIKKANDFNYKELEIIEEENKEELENNVEKTNKEIVVHIEGEVENEGIVIIEENARIADVIEKAGGVREEADLSKVNLAYKVEDGQKIHIPNINDKEIVQYIIEEAGENVIENEESKSEKVNINTASQTELETLNGIGPSTALKIINYRKENGKFQTIEDIKNVPGIGDSKFENIKEDICAK